MADATGAVMNSNPYTAVLGAAMGAAQAPPAGPSEAKSSGTIGGSMFDNSGWNVSFGDSSPISASRQQETAMSKYMPYVLAGAGFLLAWKLLKSKK